MSMNIQRFHAPTAREALALARAAFGEGTLILSNRQLGTGVEVVAAAESELAALDTSTLTLPPAITAAPERRAPPARPERAAEPAAAAAKPEPSTQEVVRADTEQLSMSTLSFQDYVRERMLRRQHGEASAPRETASTRRAAPPQALAEAEPDIAPAPAVPAAAEALVEALIELPADTPAEAPAPRQPAAIAPERESNAATDLSRTLMAELQAMKGLMEDRFNTLAWLGQAKRDPIHSNLMLKLVRAGFSPSLTRAVLEPIALCTDASVVVNEVMATLERMLAIAPDAPSLCAEGGIFALVGATGVGKTTTAAKLAARCIRRHGASSVGLVTLDIHRAGAHEQLRAYARSLGVVAHLAHDRAALQELLTLLSGKKMVLVDTAGFAPRDLRRRDMLDMVDMPNVKRVLVLNAGAHGDTMDEAAAAFKVGGASLAVLSKVDEAAKLGPAIDVLIRHRLSLRGVANGQRVPEDWRSANAEALVRESMRAAQRSHFDPRSADLDILFSPADCAA